MSALLPGQVELKAELWTSATFLVNQNLLAADAKWFAVLSLAPVEALCVSAISDALCPAVPHLHVQH